MYRFDSCQGHSFFARAEKGLSLPYFFQFQFVLQKRVDKKGDVGGNIDGHGAHERADGNVGVAVPKCVEDLYLERMTEAIENDFKHKEELPYGGAEQFLPVYVEGERQQIDNIDKDLQEIDHINDLKAGM